MKIFKTHMNIIHKNMKIIQKHMNTVHKDMTIIQKYMKIIQTHEYHTTAYANNTNTYEIIQQQCK